MCTYTTWIFIIIVWLWLLAIAVRHSAVMHSLSTSSIWFDLYSCTQLMYTDLYKMHFEQTKYTDAHTLNISCKTNQANEWIHVIYRIKSSRWLHCIFFFFSVLISLTSNMYHFFFFGDSNSFRSRNIRWLNWIRTPSNCSLLNDVCNINDASMHFNMWLVRA